MHLFELIALAGELVMACLAFLAWRRYQKGDAPYYPWICGTAIAIVLTIAGFAVGPSPSALRGGVILLGVDLVVGAICCLWDKIAAGVNRLSPNTFWRVLGTSAVAVVLIVIFSGVLLTS